MANGSARTTVNQHPEIGKLLDRVKDLLDAGKPQDALKILSRESSEWARNARSVCFLRLGQPTQAVETLRGLVIDGVLNLREDAPMTFKTNFATALLLSGNISGGIGTLHDIRDDANPEVQRLRSAVAKWRESMTFWQKFGWLLGIIPNHPLTIDGPPGDIG